MKKEEVNIEDVINKLKNSINYIRETFKSNGIYSLDTEKFIIETGMNNHIELFEKIISNNIDPLKCKIKELQSKIECENYVRYLYSIFMKLESNDDSRYNEIKTLFTDYHQNGELVTNEFYEYIGTKLNEYLDSNDGYIFNRKSRR